jgi:hypothetical protein
MKLIVANGCSMASGFECTEPGKQLPTDWQHAWPKHLCDTLGTDGCNMSRAGQSNWSIAVNVQSIIMQQFADRDPKDLLVVVGWTEFTRSEFIADDIFYFNAGFNERFQKGDLDADQKRKDVYYAYQAWVHQSIDSHLAKFAWTYWSLKNFLDLRGIPYFFFNSINKPTIPNNDLLICSDPKRRSPDVIWNTMLNDPCYYHDETQFQWLSKNYPNHIVGNGIGQHHWNSEALKAWAEFIAPKIIDR